MATHIDAAGKTALEMCRCRKRWSGFRPPGRSPKRASGPAAIWVLVWLEFLLRSLFESTCSSQILDRHDRKHFSSHLVHVDLPFLHLLRSLRNARFDYSHRARLATASKLTSFKDTDSVATSICSIKLRLSTLHLQIKLEKSSTRPSPQPSSLASSCQAYTPPISLFESHREAEVLPDDKPTSTRAFPDQLSSRLFKEDHSASLIQLAKSFCLCKLGL